MSPKLEKVYSAFIESFLKKQKKEYIYKEDLLKGNLLKELTGYEYLNRHISRFNVQRSITSRMSLVTDFQLEIETPLTFLQKNFKECNFTQKEFPFSLPDGEILPYLENFDELTFRTLIFDFMEKIERASLGLEPYLTFSFFIFKNEEKIATLKILFLKNRPLEFFVDSEIKFEESTSFKAPLEEVSKLFVEKNTLHSAAKFASNLISIYSQRISFLHTTYYGCNNISERTSSKCGSEISINKIPTEKDFNSSLIRWVEKFFEDDSLRDHKTKGEVLFTIPKEKVENNLFFKDFGTFSVDDLFLIAQIGVGEKEFKNKTLLETKRIFAQEALNVFK